MLIVIGDAGFAGIDHQIENGIFADAQKARDGANRIAVADEMQDTRALFTGELAHALLNRHMRLKR